MRLVNTQTGIELPRLRVPGQDKVLTSEALEFVAELHRRFEPARQELLRRRRVRQAALDGGARLGFLPETRHVRESTWQVAAPPKALEDRRVEITGPTDAKMMINGLNSGACVYMADFEDANVPTWRNMVEGQINVRAAVRGNLGYQGPDGKAYTLNRKVATLVVRPRGWHLQERHVKVDGQPVSASLFDFGLFFVHNARQLMGEGFGPYLYLPKLESHLEARLWAEVFAFAEDRHRMARNVIRPTVLIETLPAAFEMEEILFELKDRSVALNAGRWDYLFSALKCMRAAAGPVLPDRAVLTMDQPFLRAYAQLLVKTCHARGAYAIGGMSAYVPSRKDPQRNESALREVRADKEREAGDGFDGTWVAHPDLVPVALEAFNARLGERKSQLERQRDDVQVTEAQLRDLTAKGGAITQDGVKANVRVCVRYLSAWLCGQGAVAIDGKMEDTATAEIARTQLWKWLDAGAPLAGGGTVTEQVVRQLAADEAALLLADPDVPDTHKVRVADAQRLLEAVCLGPVLPDFLTTEAQAWLK